MLTLTLGQVRLQADVGNKEEAIRAVGQLLVSSGCIEPGYIESMMGREAVANTFLGHGIAIPHGLQQHRELINQTGIAVLQVPDGVTWNPGEKARLVVGIAARSGEHIEVLRRLTRVLSDDAAVERLSTTTDATDIIEALTGVRPTPPPAINDVPADFEHAFEAVLENEHGLHARPATFLVDVAKQFDAEVQVRHGAQVANGKSLIALLQLGVEKGSTMVISAAGPQAEAAIQALQAAVAEGLGEGDDAQQEEEMSSGEHDWTPRAVGLAIHGISASPGLAIGQVRHYVQQDIVVEDYPSNPTTEGNKLQDALDAARVELDALYEGVKQRMGSNKAAIFRAHAEFLYDTALVRDAVSTIFDGHSAAWAWQQAINQRVSQLQKLDDPVLAGRAVDLSDVGQRVLGHLVGQTSATPLAGDAPVILLAQDLAPSDTAAMDPDNILGFCTVVGGPTSHTAIMARSLDIPALVAAGDSLLKVQDGTLAILDGYHGRLYLKPSEADITAAREVQRQLEVGRDAARASRFQPATTTDGHRIEVVANINRAAGVPPAVEAGAEGVGLMRTEFLFLERDSAPDEEEQFEAYRAMAEALGGRTLIIRTLDIGGDKEVPYLNLPKEDNSFLGIRGIRLCLVRPDLFIPQLRAIYRAATFGPIKIMFPMISTLEDWTRARDTAEQVRKELHAPEVELGIMVEVPSAVLLADHLAKEVAFFSVGTNDLTQYLLAMDRLHPQLAKQADALHPAVLRAIDQTVRAAQKEGKWVGVCGGVAGDPKGALLLAGLGVTELSMAVPSIPAIKAQLRGHSLADMQALAQKALQCRTAKEVRAL